MTTSRTIDQLRNDVTWHIRTPFRVPTVAGSRSPFRRSLDRYWIEIYVNIHVDWSGESLNMLNKKYTMAPLHFLFPIVLV